MRNMTIKQISCSRANPRIIKKNINQLLLSFSLTKTLILTKKIEFIPEVNLYFDHILYGFFL